MKDDLKYFGSVAEVAATIRPGWMCAAAILADNRIAVYGNPVRKEKGSLLSCYLLVLKLRPLRKKGLVIVNHQGIVKEDGVSNVVDAFGKGGD